ncbi:DNA-processing protein DprA [Chloroflexota bacterium]
MDSDDIKYRVGFNLIPGIGRVKLSLLEAYFGDLGKAWHASASELRSAGLDAKSVETVITQRGRISLDAELEKMERHKVRAITGSDPAYPIRLKEIYDYPPLLYIRGTLAPEDEWAIAVVGTRRASIYGRQVAEEMVADLSCNGITIISGLAKGIDSIAHRTALAAGGRTIAVTGCGLDIVYPSDHVDLARQVTERGALISEFPLGTRPKAEHFPLRNRIMSGMSLGVLVIEAGERSGATITAHRAVEQNREVFAVPGSIFSPVSKGTNRLIQEGAKLVRNCADVLEELNLTMLPQHRETKEVFPATDIESQLLDCLSREAIHIDDLCRNSGLPVAAVSSTLAMLELRGLAKQVGNMNYVLS